MTEKRIVNEPEKNLFIEPLTRHEIHSDIENRIQLITKEFAKGFNFIKNYPKSVTVFGGTRFQETNPYYKMAYTLGERIAKELKYSVFTGGGPGIMEAANKGAFEANGQSLGLTIELPHIQATNPYLTDHIDLYYFFVRKVCMSFSAEAYIFMPGGFGTMDEFFEILTLIQTNKIEKVPMILVGSDFWNKVDTLIKDEMMDRLSVDEEDTHLYTITDNLDEIIDIIRRAPIRSDIPFNYSDKK